MNMKVFNKLKNNISLQLCICLVTLVIDLIVTVTNSWSVREFNTLNNPGDTKERTVGLFIKCTIYVPNEKECESYTDTSDWLRCCRAMSILSCLLQFSAVVLTLAIMLKHTKRFDLLAAACFCSGVCMLITITVFAAMNQGTKHNFYKYSWSFILSIIATLFSAVCGIYAITMMRVIESQPKE
ncbi:uncharacterized protein cldnl2 isoform X2 [Hydra vulgaris]|uniref:Uncharacterized protein cldnl2 isoform X2 n=1 Tax=Hydra vulgaris TaxID=6087 RepID=A0ABM4CYK5_HYDVU